MGGLLLLMTLIARSTCSASPPIYSIHGIRVRLSVRVRVGVRVGARVRVRVLGLGLGLGLGLVAHVRLR